MQWIKCKLKPEIKHVIATSKISIDQSAKKGLDINVNDETASEGSYNLC